MPDKTESKSPIRPEPTSFLTGLFLWPEWGMEWILYILSQMALFEILSILSKLSILVGFIFFVCEAGDRKELKHLEAWRVIVSMRNQSGNGGRISALQSLNEDKVSLMGIDVQRAYLSMINMQAAKLQEANFSGSTLFQANFEKATLDKAVFGCISQQAHESKCTDLYKANFQLANLSNAYLSGDLRDAGFVDARLLGAKFVKADLQGANFERADLKGTHFLCVMNLTPEQIKHAKNWQDAYYDEKTSRILGLPSKPKVNCSALQANSSTNRLEESSR
jgi:Pentapeptide repeats (8 copies)